jgi:sugar transferase (PEP-CTERM/EpsH1 system associated)
MQDLLFLAHRIPYPPDKGEKIRAWHALDHLARTHRIHLGCFIDDPADAAHLPVLAARCADVAAIRLDRRRQRLLALARLRRGRPLSLGYFHDFRLAAWVAAKRAQGIDRAFVYCSAMAPYLCGAHDMVRVLDMVDVDSAKWEAYAQAASWPLRLVWAREARTLSAFEQRAAADFDRTLFVSAEECAAFVARLDRSATAARCDWYDNGVDAAYFDPEAVAAPPPWPTGGPQDGPVAVFTGTMDYRPNIAATLWFAEAVLPRLRVTHPTLRFAVVGANPAPAVTRLAARTGVIVTGRVADVRPSLAHAAVAVAPLMIARGIQNKVLEAMAMARPVVATPAAFAGLRAVPGRDLLVADGAPSFADAVAAVLDGRHPALGAAARAAVLARYAWGATLARLDAAMAANPLPSVSHEVMA